MSTGVVAIYTDKDGRVIASVSDFDRSGYGGCSLEEAQGIRAKRALSRAVANAYCSPVFADKLNWMDCEKVMLDDGRQGHNDHR